MKFRDIKLAFVTASLIAFSSSALAANLNPRTCAAVNAVLQQNVLPIGGSGGTGHETPTPPGGIGGTGNTPDAPIDEVAGNSFEAATENGGIGGTGNMPLIPPGGVGGNGIEAAAEGGGIGGTGNAPVVPPGGIGGTGITLAGVISKSHGEITVVAGASFKQTLKDGDEICAGDRIIVANNSQAKLKFSDGALLHVLKNTEITVDDYSYAPSSPKESRSTISLVKGDIRSVSGAISKINPAQYAIKTPVATIRVIGTDFMVTHLPENNKGTLSGTYVKVLSGEVNVVTVLSSIVLRAKESVHVLLSGIQSIIESGGGTCAIP